MKIKLEIHLFLQGLASPLTRANYLSDVRALEAWFRPFTGQEDSLAIIKWVRSMEAANLKRTTIKGRLIRVRRIYALLIEKELRKTENPVRLDCIGRVRDIRAPKCPTLDELKNLTSEIDFSTLEGARQGAIFGYLLFEGLRCHEVAGLKLSDLIKIGDQWQCSVRGKNGVLSEVSLWPQTKKALRKYLSLAKHRHQDTPLFYSLTRPGNLRLSTRAVRRIIDQLFREAGIRNGLSCHSLRHAHGTLLASMGVPLSFIQRRLRHTDILTTLRYINDEPSMYQAQHRRPEESFPIKLGHNFEA